MIEPKPFLTTVGTRSLIGFSKGRLEVELRSIDASRQYELRPFEEPKGEQGLLVQSEGVPFTIVSRSIGKEKSKYRTALAASALTWAEAGVAVSGTGAELIVAAVGASSDHAASVKIAFLLQVISTAVAATVAADYIYWGTADLLIEPESFATATASMLNDNVPPTLQWVSFHLYPGPVHAGEWTGGMRSKGLQAFVGYELVLEPIAMRPMEIARRATGIADHLIKEGVIGAFVPGPDPGERLNLERSDGPDLSYLNVRVERAE